MKQREISVRERAEKAYAATVLSRAELLESGMSPRDITESVRGGSLRRLRRDRYAAADVSDDVAEAVRIGGRLSCLSLLKLIGVFVLNCTSLHVHVRPGTSRTRKPVNEATIVHWDTWSGQNSPFHAVALLDAARQAVRCQKPRAAIATLDSLLHHRLLTREQLTLVFASLPSRFGVLLALVDSSAESGPETLMRLILRTLGVSYETQVVIPGVGRVDFLVEGWLIIECDSKTYHEGWDKQVEDRARDISAAGLGYVTVRPIATDLMHSGVRVQTAIADVLKNLGPRFRSYPLATPQKRSRRSQNQGQNGDDE